MQDQSGAAALQVGSASAPEREMMVVPQQPWWRQAYDWAERTISPALEAEVRSDTFADLLAATVKIRADLDRRRLELGDKLSAVSARCLHWMNMPAAGDVAHLREEILRLDRQLRAVTRQLDQASRKGNADDRAGKPNGDTEVGPS